MGETEIDVDADQLPKTFTWLVRLRDGAIECRGEGIVSLVADGAKDVLLGREIEVEAGFRKPGLLGQRSRGDPRETLVREQFLRRRQDFVAPLLPEATRFAF